MSMGIKYRGKFLSCSDVEWDVRILKEGYSGLAAELTFPYDCPLEINWLETSKIDTIQASSATLKVISESDREFIDLYTVAVGEIRLDIYRNGVLYWSGLIDTELYEEPYRSESGYEVTLTFSDFAVLERKNWTSRDFRTMSAIITDCLTLMGINYIEVVKYISTGSNHGPVTLSDVLVNEANFYDEEDEGMNAREVLEAVLLPFALRMIQKAGRIYIYDLNALYSLEASNVEQDGEDGALSVDRVYNNVKVTFSPYAESTLMKGYVKRDEHLTDTSGGHLVHVDYNNLLTRLDGFRLHYNTTLASNLVLSGNAKYFQINPIYSGNEEQGVIMSYRDGDYPVKKNGDVNPQTRQLLNAPFDCGTLAGGNVNTGTIITCPRAYLGRSSGFLRLNLSLLFDTRYNPFEDASEYNDEDAFEDLQNWCNYAYVPIKLTLEDASGTALYHYENYLSLESTGYNVKGTWKTGAAAWGHAYLCYYDREDLKSSTGLGGWKSNQMMIGYYRGDLPQSWKRMDEGDYIPMPPVGGYLKMEIGSGIHQFDYGREVRNIYKYTRWVAYKEPSITVCKANYKPLETEDLEDSAWLNAAAKEELSLETIVGTVGLNRNAPSAKGLLYDASFSPYYEFSRNGVYDRLERLLIGTVYSQYASRHIAISGTMQLLPAFGIYGHQATEGKFIVLEENQDLRADTSVIKMVELSEDNYEGIDYE